MFIIGEDRRLVVPRTELTYPGHNERMHENAATAPVDHVMADLEDACPYEFKGEKSRNTIITAFNELDYGEKVIKYKLNNAELETAHHLLRPGSLIRITNMKTNDSIIIKNKTLTLSR